MSLILSFALAVVNQPDLKLSVTNVGAVRGRGCMAGGRSSGPHYLWAGDRDERVWVGVCLITSEKASMKAYLEA